jgi:V/A-type H+-transporting ATPase subunit F
MKYYVIGDEDTVLALSMVGVDGVVVNEHDTAAATKAFQAARADKTIGIIIITERIAALIRTLVDKYVFSKTFPLLVEIPDRKGPLPGRIGIRETVNAAIGVAL